MPASCACSSCISHDSEATPCCRVGTPGRIHLGDMAQDGVQALCNNQAYRAFRAQLSSDMPPEVRRRYALYSGTF